MALRLAIGDAYAAGGALADDLAAIVASQAQAKPEQRQAEAAINQIGRLNEWLEVNAPALYHNPDLDTAAAIVAELGVRDRRMIEQSAAIADLRISLIDANEDAASAHQELTTLIAERDGLRQQIVQMDADNAELVRQLRQARNEADARWFSGDQELSEQLRLAQAEIDRLTRQNVIATDTFNSLAAERTNGAGPNPTTAPGWNRSHPAWSGLPKADLDVIDQLTSGATTFRKLAKTLRRDLVIRVLRSLAVDGEVKALTYDKRKPDWMPTSGAVVMLSETGRWSNLLAMALTPA
jgi:hypothetical protein